MYVSMKIEGLPVRDGKKSVLLHITEADIKKSKIKDPEKCAAAVACRRELGATEAHIHTTRCYLKFNGHWVRYMTTPRLRSELVAFDRGGKMEPGEYRLSKMQPSRQGDVSRNKGKSRNTGRKRRSYHRLVNVRPMAIVN